ncbi:MAG: polyketide synthase, partial [Proteobacteria bacterium]|nr:polyketide synthase [Pseudomonadota bacterium]
MADNRTSDIKKALLAIRELKAKIKQLESNNPEPIAVIGMGCRFPGGVYSPENYWQLLTKKIDAISEVPSDRWDINEYFDEKPGQPGKMYTRWGGFLDHIDQFDPHFFGVSPREAAGLDPQQRLLLEVSWEAMENSGLNPHTLEGSNTGVFIGITASDYAFQQIKEGNTSQIDAYFGTGNALNAAAGRLAYTFGLQGPAMIVDTACSSSLVAIHLACHSLNNRESNLTIAGGVNVILSPESTIATSQAKMLSPTGRCKTFDESADGYVRGEGCGIVVLKRLADALKNGDAIQGVIKATAVNQDGQSAGFTVPNGVAQQTLIEEALNKAQLSPSDIDYIEAHGTGTSLGDPIEINALNRVFGTDRDSEYPLLVGSVKTNIGHLESASGIAGLIKTLLALQHQKIPAHLHLNKVNPHIPLANMPISVPLNLSEWPNKNTLHRAGVSSFGFSGTNAHVIIEQSPEVPTARQD